MTTAQPSPGRYDYHDQYYSLNTGAHRKGGVELLMPTLTHHLGLWYPRVSTSDVGERSVDKFGKVVDRYVWTLYRALRDFQDFEHNFGFIHHDEHVVCLFGGVYHAKGDALLQYQPQEGTFHYGLEDARDSDNKILFIKARWHGLTIIVRCEFHSEYFTATRFVTVTDFDNVPPNVSAICASLTQLSKLNKDDQIADEIAEAAHVQLYRHIWEILDEQVFDWTGVFADFDKDSRLRIFADFRGLVVFGNDRATAGPLSHISSKGEETTAFDADYAAKRLLPSIWPFLKVKNGLDLKRREFTASYMLGGRAVYITALGPQPPANDRFDCAPLQYFLVARPVSDWQLGALVDRLHFMGTVRLAALMELSALRRAGANLRDMDKEIDLARQQIESNNLEAATQHHQNAIRLIAHTDKNGPIFWAGLQFRVERSRYYVQRFQDFVDFLDIDPIEGYQPYDLFVKGRLGGVYDYIDRLGRRQERAIRSTESIYQLISLKEAATTSRKIAEANELGVIATQQSAEANRQSAEANRQSAEANRQSAEANRRNSIISQTIEKLQTKAELALVAVILPHYIIGIINDLDDRTKRGDHKIWREDVSILIVSSVFAFISLVVYLIERQKFDRRTIERMLLKYGIPALLSVVLVKFFISQ